MFPPKRRNGFIIPQVDGTYQPTAERYYDDRTITVDCVLNKRVSRFDFRQIAHWLSIRRRLQFWNEPELHYYAEIFDPADVTEWQGESGKTFTATFIADPFAYSEYITVPIVRGINRIQYNGTHSTPAVITIENTGTDTIRSVTLTAIRRKVE